MDKKSEMTNPEMKKLIQKVFTRFPLFFLFMALVTLLPAGTFNYWQVYLFLAIFIVPMIFTLFYFLKHDPKFLERRIHAKEKEKTQLVFQFFSAIIHLGGFIISGLDRRFGWSDVPVHFVLIADAVILSGYFLIFNVFRQNSYASRIVEVEANQEVISTGLYSIVRHPMYFGILIMFLPMPIALGSWWALIPIATLPFAFAVRLLNEESVLKKELPGYEEYCRKTKYRLIPYIW